MVKIINGVEVKGSKHPNGGGFIADTAFAAKTAYIGGEARVYGGAQVYGEARVCGETKIPHKLNGATFSCNSYSATVNEGFIQIGCYAKPIDDWLALSQKEASKLGLPVMFYNQYRAFGEMIKILQERED